MVKTMSDKLKKGSLVLATEYLDGSPSDHWAIGFFQYEQDSMCYVIDIDDETDTLLSFQRCEPITIQQAAFISDHSSEIESSGDSLLHYTKCEL